MFVVVEPPAPRRWVGALVPTGEEESPSPL